MQPRVLLVYPPFGSLCFPSIGLSLLKAQLRRSGIDCTIAYLNYDFLDRLPGEALQRLSTFDAISRRNEYSLGDWLFNGAVFRPEQTAMLDERFCRFVRESGESDDFVARCFQVKAAVPAFVRWAAETIAWNEYSVVGFHSIFSQTMAAMALAAAVKERFPHLVTLFGGPSATGDMGTEVLRQFEQIDYVVQGEADETIVPIIRGLTHGADISGIPGVIYRTAGVDGNKPAVTTNPIALVSNLDALPRPDYSDFFERFNNRGYEPAIQVFLPIENSRGCWWGAKHHCTFCGLNSNSMTFRRKRSDVIFEELVAQSEQHDIRSFACVDSILDMACFDDLLPRLRDANLGLRLFYEVKANLTQRQVGLLADAGVTLLQPGLEHLSTEVLKLMRKGTTFLQNVQFLKWARERNLTVFWAVLYGFPGETFEAYEEIAARMPALHHLFPPKAAVRVRVDRFSPLFTRPQELGLAAVKPARAYQHVYPFDEAALRGLAYHFEGEYADRDPSLNDRIYDAIANGIRVWNERFFRDGAGLDQVVGTERLLVRDTRDPENERYLLVDSLAARVLSACNSHTSRQSLEDLAAAAVASADGALTCEMSFADAVIGSVLEQAEDSGIPVIRSSDACLSTLARVLDWLCSEGLVVREGERYLALPCVLPSADALLRSRRADLLGLMDVAATRRVVLEGVA